MKKYIGVDLGGTNIRAAVVDEEGGFSAWRRPEAIRNGSGACDGNHDIADRESGWI